MKLKAAVIGCGRIAIGFDDDPKRKMVATHIGAYQHVKGVEVVAVCDVDGSRVDKVCRKRGITKGYTDYLKMLRQEKVDMVSVCTPPKTHASIVLDIARHGLAKAIFCEKPMAHSLQDARAMIDACAEHNIILQIDHQRRFDQMHQAIRAKIQRGAWGRVQRANFYYSAGVRNTGSHMFDLLRFFFGDADWVQAYASANPSRRPDDPNLDGFVRFPNGLLASFQALDHTRYLIFELDCYFQRSRLVLKHSGFDAEFYKVGKSSFFSGYRELEKGKAPFKKDYERSLMVRGVEELSRCLGNGRKSISSGEDGLRAMELIELSIKSAQHHGKQMSVSPKR
ncbi:MAG: Gfo/Idh/MocA family oxidoreductase [Candidatus Omnitrophica bacterium]|nr:Gfo/Idh/MocA family oxidoreductase [Candidatus Omnitrophota bacterium]